MKRALPGMLFHDAENSTGNIFIRLDMNGKFYIDVAHWPCNAHPALPGYFVLACNAPSVDKNLLLQLSIVREETLKQPN